MVIIIESGCQHLVDVLDFVDQEYRNEIADLIEAMFDSWGVTRLTISEDEGLWRAIAELTYEAIEVIESHPIAAIMKLFPYLMLYKAAQHLCK